MAPDVGLGAEGPVERGRDLWIASVVMVTVAGLFVAARFVERVRRNGRSGLGLDDWMILAALLSSVVLSVTEIEAVHHGYGRHFTTVPLNEIIVALKWFFAAQVMYKVVLVFDKVSILCMYYRIFYVNRTFRKVTHAVNAFIITSGIAFILATIFQCRPLSGFWNRAMNPFCINSEAFWISYATINIVTDIVILALPVRQVMRLQISQLERFGLIFVFFTGCCVTVTSIIRTTTLAASAKDKDPTWGPLPATLWSVIEANAGIIAACLPTLRRPFSYLFSPLVPRGFRTLDRSGHRHTGAPSVGPLSSPVGGKFGANLFTENMTITSLGRNSYGYPTNDQASSRSTRQSYELDHRSSSSGTFQHNRTDSESRMIILPDSETQLTDGVSNIQPGLAYSTPSSQPQPLKSLFPLRTNSNSGVHDGKIYVENDISVSVSPASTAPLRPSAQDYYADSGSDLRTGKGRQYSFSMPRIIGKEREGVE